ncbi:hypothetical protein [Bosea caraganae]|uniref:hypothetical protein n=1 Tax=Bosea caraganae TaxID=2763117 RepID=UPI0011C07ECB|nr:hypothetical protein [Bosea caraganae]
MRDAWQFRHPSFLEQEQGKRKAALLRRRAKLPQGHGIRVQTSGKISKSGWHYFGLSAFDRRPINRWLRSMIQIVGILFAKGASALESD